MDNGLCVYRVEQHRKMLCCNVRSFSRSRYGGLLRRLALNYRTLDPDRRFHHRKKSVSGTGRRSPNPFWSWQLGVSYFSAQIKMSRLGYQLDLNIEITNILVVGLGGRAIIKRLQRGNKHYNGNKCCRNCPTICVKDDTNENAKVSGRYMRCAFIFISIGGICRSSIQD